MLVMNYHKKSVPTHARTRRNFAHVWWNQHAGIFKDNQFSMYFAGIDEASELGICLGKNSSLTSPRIFFFRFSSFEDKNIPVISVILLWFPTIEHLNWSKLYKSCTWQIINLIINADLDSIRFGLYFHQRKTTESRKIRHSKIIFSLCLVDLSLTRPRSSSVVLAQTHPRCWIISLVNPCEYLINAHYPQNYVFMRHH